MNTRILGAVAALLLAVIGTVILVVYVQGADQRALRGAATTDVYLVDKAVPAGTPGAQLESFVRKASLPASAVSNDAVRDLGTAAGKVTSVSLVPGEQVLSSRLVDPASLQTPGKAAVPAGMQEVTVQLSPERVLGGQLAAGDTVGIFVSFAPAGADPATTHLVFQKVLITSVQGAPAASNKDGSASPAAAPPVPAGTMLITFARNAPDAERIVFAAEFGTIWLSKEPMDATENGTGIITKDGYYR